MIIFLQKYLSTKIVYAFYPAGVVPYPHMIGGEPLRGGVEPCYVPSSEYYQPIQRW